MKQSILCVGADVHLKEIVLRAVDKLTSDEVIAPFRVTNNLPGAQAAAVQLVEVATDLNYNCIQIGYEATGMLWIPFHRFLKTSQLLEPFELQQVCFNPKLVADFKDALVLRGPKDDDRDAFDVAARVQFGHWPDSYVPDDFWGRDCVGSLAIVSSFPGRSHVRRCGSNPMPSSNAVIGSALNPLPMSLEPPVPPC